MDPPHTAVPISMSRDPLGGGGVSVSAYETYRSALAGRSLPAAVVDLDLFDQNAAALATRAGGRRVRVASKSVRCRALLQRILARGDGFAGILCFSPREAAFLAAQGLDDLVVAYPAGCEAALRAVCREIARGRRITLMVDEPAQADHLESVAAAEGVTLPVALDVDMSWSLPGLHFGVRRSPVCTVSAAVALARAVQGRAHLRLDGLMGYEAQIAGLGDDASGAPLRSVAIRLLKAASRPRIARLRGEVVHALAEAGVSLRFVNGGGTGSLESTRAEPWVTELAAGSGFFAPALFDTYRAFRHLPAAFFALEVTRRPAPGLFTCLGGGLVASGPAGRDRLPRPFLPEGARLLPAEGAGEVQTPVRYQGPVRLALGDPIFFRHAKAGELCEHFNTLLLVSRGRVVDEVPTYRGEGQAFP